MKYNLKNKVELADYIYYLIKTDSVYKFYKTPEWQALKSEVLKEQHNECQVCKRKGKYTKADTVHHCKFVRSFPQLALSKTYIDDKGIDRINLIAICKTCHNQVHPEKINKNRKPKFTNKERW